MNRRVAPLRESTEPEPLVSTAAAQRNAPPRQGLRHWLHLHRRAAADAWSRISQRRAASLIGLTLSALALALPLMFAVLLANLQQLTASLQHSGEIAVFLEPNQSSEKAQALRAQLMQADDVAAVDLRTPAQGLEELQSVSGFAEAIEAAGENPLPYLLLVKPTHAQVIDTLATRLAALPGVDLVQHDQQWQRRLQSLLKLLREFSAALALLFGLGCVLVIGNHVRVEVAMRRDEIAIIKLLGASDGFVRRPFLWSGFLLGLSSAVLAVLIALLAVLQFSTPVSELAQTYQSAFVLQGPQFAMVGATLAAGVLLGSLGAYLASTWQLAIDRAF